MLPMKKVTYLILMLTLACGNLYAHHIRGGNITYRRVDPQGPTYEITVTANADTDSPVLFGGNGVLDFEDGTVEAINNQGETRILFCQ